MRHFFQQHASVFRCSLQRVRAWLRGGRDARRQGLPRPYPLRAPGILATALLGLLLAACVPAAPTSMPPLAAGTAVDVHLNSDFPGVLRGVAESANDEYPLIADQVCFVMRGDAFWERGAVWDSPEDLPRFAIRLNDQPPVAPTLTFYPPVIPVSDGRGGTAGAVPSGYDYCFRAADLNAGRYIVDVVVSAPSGFIYQYTWTLVVP